MEGSFELNKIYIGDCRQELQNRTHFPDSSVDLIVTSPPYSTRRVKSYGGVSPADYVEWFLPISQEMLRILKPTGSLVINIKEHAEGGERSTYVIEMILAMRQQGWKWVEEYCWYKKTSYPGKWRNRFRDSWERCLHFTKARSFFMDQDAVKVPIGDWSKRRFKTMTENDYIKYVSRNNEHLSRNVSNWLNRQTVFPHNVLVFENEHYCHPSNVLEICPVTHNRNHSACFPIELPIWFIKLLSREGDVVMDPFSGIGTTALASIQLGRNFLGVEKEESFVQIAEANIEELRRALECPCER